jgi:hypothetical protein
MKVETKDIGALDAVINFLNGHVRIEGNPAKVKNYIITKNQLSELRKRLIKQFLEQEFPGFEELC